MRTAVRVPGHRPRGAIVEKPAAPTPRAAGFSSSPADRAGPGWSPGDRRAAASIHSWSSVCFSLRLAGTARASSEPSRPSSGPWSCTAPPVYVRKQIVHNVHVVRDLEARGAVFVESEEDVPEGATLVFSRPRRRPGGARERGGARAADDRRDLPARREGARRGAPLRGRGLLGRPDRPRRPRGGRRHAWARRRTRSSLVETVAEAEALGRRGSGPPRLRDADDASVDDTAEIVGVLRRRFPDIQGPRARTSATRRRTASGP